MKTMDAELIAKLPKWAQTYIRTTENERDAAVATLNKFINDTDETLIWCEDNPCTGENGKGRELKRHYIQSRKVHFKVGRTEMTVHIQDAHGDKRQLIVRADDEIYLSPCDATTVKIVEK